MFDASLILGICCLYVGALFFIALWVERKAQVGRDVGNHPAIYALSLTVYLTAWTYYGSVGKAAATGTLFLTFYLGPTLVIILWWALLRRMVRIKNAYRVTSIADFISLRYNKSPSIAALVTGIALLGMVPYIALQLKAIITTFELITQPQTPGEAGWARMDIGLVIAVLLALFTIILGVRRVVPTERHQGMVVAMAVESLVKLAALLAVGLFVTYQLFDGWGDLWGRFGSSAFVAKISAQQMDPAFYLTWTTYLVISMAAFMFLPRQFHMMVVENFQEGHIRTAMWLCPLYMLLITVFILPIAMGGLLTGLPVEGADTYVLRLPMASGKTWLSLLVFLGGFSAATGMIMISSMTISTMVTNHLLLPAIEPARSLAFIKRHLLQCRWGCVALLILTAYWFEHNVGVYFTLVDIGVISFVAVLQFVPAIIGGLFWTRGNRAGAFGGMSAGILVWAYTLILPAFAQGGWIPSSFLQEGPWGIQLLRPVELLGVKGLDSTSHAVFWSMLLNIGLYLLGSLVVRTGREERSLAADLVHALASSGSPMPLRCAATIGLSVKQQTVEVLFREYFPPAKSAELARGCVAALGLEDKAAISIMELAELYQETEKSLAGSIGAAAAHRAVHKSALMTLAEERALKATYADLMAELKIAPSDLKQKIDYHRERELLLRRQAAELEEKVRERDREIAQRQKAVIALQHSEKRLADIINFLPDPTFAIDEQGRVIIWNRAAEEFTGIKSEDMLGRGNQEYAVPFYGERRPLLIDLVFRPAEEAERLYTNLRREGEMILAEAFTRTSRGGEAYLIATAAPLIDFEGRVIGAIESLRDITQRKRSEEELGRHRDHLEDLVRERTAELRLAKEQAERANQAKTSFLSSMSHELRTPLNAILGYTQILRRHDNLTEAQHRQLGVIQSSGEHLLALINDLLDLGRIEAQKMALNETVFSLPAVLQQVLKVTQVKAEEKRLRMDYEERDVLPAFVRGDERKLQQVLLNLLSNAVKCTTEGRVVLRVSFPGESMRCEVADTGPGIAKDEQEAIFEPFRRVADSHPSAEGTGLGLSITKRLVMLMGGRLGVESEPGKGAMFWVELPLPTVEGAVRVETTELLPVGYLGQRKRVLAVDDNPANLSLVVDLLQPLGFEVVVATGGREAVRTAQEKRPHLVLLDLVMPELDGREVAQELRACPDLAQTPIIGLSATVSGSEGQRKFQSLCDGFLPKPIQADRLLEQVRRHLKIEWQTKPECSPQQGTAGPAQTATSETTLPPAAMRMAMRRAVERGEFGELERLLAASLAQNPAGAWFCQRIQRHAARYEEESILAFLNSFEEPTDPAG